MVPMPRTRAMSQTAFTGVIWPVMLIWCEMRMRRVGTYAEFALCTTEQVHPLPANISFAQGAAIGTPYATAYRGLFQRGDAKPGETVLVHGASGGVGTAAVQLARARGLRVFGTAGSDEGIKLTRQQGAHEVFDHRVPDHFEQ